MFAGFKHRTSVRRWTLWSSKELKKGNTNHESYNLILNEHFHLRLLLASLKQNHIEIARVHSCNICDCFDNKKGCLRIFLKFLLFLNQQHIFSSNDNARNTFLSNVCEKVKEKFPEFLRKLGVQEHIVHEYLEQGERSHLNKLTVLLSATKGSLWVLWLCVIFFVEVALFVAGAIGLFVNPIPPTFQ